MEELSKKLESNADKIDDIETFRRLAAYSNIDPANATNQQRAQCEETLRELQRDTQIVSRGIVQTYLGLIGENDSYESRKEQEKLEKLPPLVVLGLVKRRFYTLQEEANKYASQTNLIIIDNKEKINDTQMPDLTKRNAELDDKMKQLKERVNGLMKSIEDESKLRIEAAVHSRAVIEAIKEDKRKLERIIKEREEEIAKIKNVRGKKEELKKETELLELEKQKMKAQVKKMEKHYTKEAKKLDKDYATGYKAITKRLEAKKALEQQQKASKKQKEIEILEKQIQDESEQDREMTRRLSELQAKLKKSRAKEKDLTEKDKLESRENFRLKKELEAQRKLNEKLTKSLRTWEDKLKNDVQIEAKKIYESIKKDIEGVILSKTKQDEYVEEILASNTRLLPEMKDMVVKERELVKKLEEREAELKRLKKNHLIQRTQLWQEKPVRKKDIRLLSQLLPQTARSPGEDKVFKKPSNTARISEENAEAVAAINNLFQNNDRL